MPMNRFVPTVNASGTMFFFQTVFFLNLIQHSLTFPKLFGGYCMQCTCSAQTLPNIGANHMALTARMTAMRATYKKIHSS